MVGSWLARQSWKVQMLFAVPFSLIWIGIAIRGNLWWLWLTVAVPLLWVAWLIWKRPAPLDD
jgi:hypothetical protein